MRPSRSLPRIFIPGAPTEGTIELPKAEIDKLRKVLRLGAGAEIAILPNDGSLVRAIFDGHDAEATAVEFPRTEPLVHVTLGQSLPKGEKLDEIVRAGTEIGVSHFVLFSTDRTVVKWDAGKKMDRIRRLESIAREAAEVCYRTRLPEFTLVNDLKEFLAKYPEADVLSEVEGVGRRLTRTRLGRRVIAIGPEGGWAPREVEMIGDLAVTIGPRVLRVEHAAMVAAGLLLAETD
jgi:16S rRNA (uracil1498-N3)-methyltransferase